MQRRFRPKTYPRRYISNQNKTNDELVMAIRAFSQLSKENDLKTETTINTKFRFEDLAISQKLKLNITSRGYTLPTPIQEQAIPIILKGRDFIGIANTGTGKTAAFLIPLIEKVLTNKSERVFILAPTRELATQIQDELCQFAKGFDIKSALIVGGLSMGKQIGDLRQNPHFVIGTPGRVKDLIQQNRIHLSQFTNVVLDEADRMVDIGFIADIKYFISLLPSRRQSLFFSATIPPKVQQILGTFVHDPVTISVKKQETAENINHDIVKVNNRDQKINQLHDLLISDGFEKVLIFGRTKWGVQKLTNELISRGFKAGVIHGNKSQSSRQKTLDQFKSNQIRVLLATDVASRGLDIDNVSHVINYDMPQSYDDYIHRIGRTGRANKKGIALTFVE